MSTEAPMVFARDFAASPDPLGPSETSSPPQTSLSFAVIRLSNLIGTGLVRIDALRRTWPLNETGARLLESVGGAYGAPAPQSLDEVLLKAGAGGQAQLSDAANTGPETRHITLAAMRSGEGALVVLRDDTEERLLQE